MLAKDTDTDGKPLMFCSFSSTLCIDLPVCQNQ